MRTKFLLTFTCRGVRFEAGSDLAEHRKAHAWITDAVVQSWRLHRYIEPAPTPTPVTRDAVAKPTGKRGKKEAPEVSDDPAS